MRSSVCSASGLLSACLLVAASADVEGAILFSENFDADHTAAWTVNNGPSTHATNFFFDYSSVGIPSAPGSGGTTRGLKMQANISGGVFGGLSVSPTGQSFSGAYTMEFDLWMNFNGPMPTGGSGSTQAGGGGIGTSGGSAAWAGNPSQESIHFGVTTDGNSATDFRAYSPSADAGYSEASGVFAAGTALGIRNGSTPYYTAAFPPTGAPIAQQTLFPQQTGLTSAGTVAFNWHHVTITNDLVNVSFRIDNLLIATVSLAEAGTLGGSNILLSYYDTNATSSTDPNAGALLFGLYDNLVVNSIVPEPSTALLAGLPLLGVLRRRRRA